MIQCFNYIITMEIMIIYARSQMLVDFSREYTKGQITLLLLVVITKKRIMIIKITTSPNLGSDRWGFEFKGYWLLLEPSLK